MNFKIKDIIKLCNGTLICGNEEEFLTALSRDTRTIQSGETYLGIKGENFDGNLLVKEAIEKGAKICVLESFDNDFKIPNDISIVLVENTIKALQQLATYKRRHLNIPIVAITGSVGKTSTKEMIASVLEQKYTVLKTLGNYNNDLGLPLTILRYTNEEVMVLEMGMNHLGEISVLSNIAKPTISVITNVGTAHIGLLGSRENILKAKLEILDGMDETGLFIYNQDNDMLKEMTNPQIKTNTFSIHEASDNQATHIKEVDEHLIYEVNGITIEVPIASEAFIYNSLAAYAVGCSLGLTTTEIQKGVFAFQSTGNRMKKEEVQGITFINDSYNANLEAMTSALEFLQKEKGTRKIAVLGDMLELNEFSEELHRKVGELVVQNKIDYLYLNGQYSKYIKDEAIKKGMKENTIFYFDDKEELAQHLKNQMQIGDTVLLKASNSLKFSSILDAIKAEKF